MLNTCYFVFNRKIDYQVYLALCLNTTSRPKYIHRKLEIMSMHASGHPLDEVRWLLRPGIGLGFLCLAFLSVSSHLHRSAISNMTQPPVLLWPGTVQTVSLRFIKRVQAKRGNMPLSSHLIMSASFCS